MTVFDPKTDEDATFFTRNEKLLILESLYTHSLEDALIMIGMPTRIMIKHTVKQLHKLGINITSREYFEFLRHFANLATKYRPLVTELVTSDKETFMNAFDHMLKEESKK